MSGKLSYKRTKRIDKELTESKDQTTVEWRRHFPSSTLARR